MDYRYLHARVCPHVYARDIDATALVYHYRPEKAKNSGGSQ